MAGQEDDAARLKALSEQLEAAKAKIAPPPKPDAGASYGQGMRIVTELLAGVVGGALVGWLLDQWFGTAPVLMLVMLALGVAGAFRSMLKNANRVAKASDATKDE
ncbi:MAG: F0F1 ATP synthase assembly protein I [Sphingomonadales bacterium]|nr:MAG: F0F1 ATP synthase assembly protein I [Sphingomonadales bacterium]